MGFFDFFGKDSNKNVGTNGSVSNRNSTDRERDFDFHLENNVKKDAPVSVFTPRAYSDVEAIIDSFKAGKNTIVHLTNIKKECAIRILDMLSGAIYALGGGVYEIQKNVFMFSPSGVESNN